MNKKQFDNSYQNDEGMLKEKTNQDYNKQKPYPNQDKKHLIAEDEEKGREDQVMAKINGKADNNRNHQKSNGSVFTNKVSSIFNESLEDDDESTEPQYKKVSMQASQLMRLFEDELEDIYWAEKALTIAIPKMIRNATSTELVEALSMHLDETHGQVERLKEVFAWIEKNPVAIKCEAMEGLIKESESIMESCEAGAMRDAGIISAAQKIEHYEIASYGTLRQFAETMGLTKVVSLLAATLEEEYSSDEALTEIAKALINVEAAELVA